jgi:TonB family protein
MQSVPKKAKRRAGSIALSLVLHGCALLLALWGATLPSFKKRPPETVARIELAGGSRAVKLALPRMPNAGLAPKAAPDPATQAKLVLPVKPKPLLKKPEGGRPPSPHAGDGTGQAETGNGSDDRNATPAFPVFSPRPPVSDRSLLPASEQKIVVDVNVDPLGAVVSEVLVKGMGNKLDQIVLDTVKTWRFQPALENGKAVPTQAELIFPFNPSYPITVS